VDVVALSMVAVPVTSPQMDDTAKHDVDPADRSGSRYQNDDLYLAEKQFNIGEKMLFAKQLASSRYLKRLSYAPILKMRCTIPVLEANQVSVIQSKLYVCQN
jgi:hypothetical protein